MKNIVFGRFAAVVFNMADLSVVVSVLCEIEHKRAICILLQDLTSMKSYQAVSKEVLIPNLAICKKTAHPIGRAVF